jgi:hypothetical protein
MAILFRTTKEVESIKPANGVSFTLEELQRLVGGYIELVPDVPSSRFHRNHWLAYCNEEGLLHRLPPNPVASWLLAVPLVGDVVLCSLEEGGEAR